MLSYENDELVVIKVCPRCAKEGRGRGLLRFTGFKYRHNVDGHNIGCRLCGWLGDDTQCQEYCFPCELQRVTVMDIEVLRNLWAFALRSDEPAKIALCNGGHYDALPTYDIKAEDCRDRLMKMDLCFIETALKIMVARGCLLPGLYKINT